MLIHYDINKLLSNLSCDAPMRLQDESVRLLTTLDESQVELLVPYITEQRYWYNLERVLIGLGYQKIKAIIPEILELLQDINYSGSKEAAEFLIKVGKPIIPSIKEILHGEDVYWKYYVLTYIVEFWPTELVKEIENEVIALTNIIDYENGLHIKALQILIRKKIGDKDGLIRKHRFMTDRYELFLKKLKDGEGELE